MRCEKCGTENPESAVFCKKCGTRLVVPVRIRVPKKPAPPQKVEKPPSALSGFIALILLILIIAVPVWYFFFRGGGPTTEFEVTSLTLSSTEAKVGDPITASVTVKNTGDVTGTRSVTLTIDGDEMETKEVTLAPGETKTVTFTLVKDVEGTYTVGASGLTKSLNVNPLTPATPATFVISNLTISPSQVELGKPVIISVDVKNEGDVVGTCIVTPKIDGKMEGSKDITLAGGETKTISFTIRKTTAQTYIVDIEGLTGSFEVKSTYPLAKTIHDPLDDEGAIAFLDIPAGFMPNLDITRVSITVYESGTFDMEIKIQKDTVGGLTFPPLDLPSGIDVFYIWGVQIDTDGDKKLDYILGFNVNYWGKVPVYQKNGQPPQAGYDAPIDAYYDSGTKTIRLKGSLNVIGGFESFNFQAVTSHQCDLGLTILDYAPDQYTWASFPY